MSERTYANIMLIGKTGVGKSSFLNYLLQDNRFKAGVPRHSGGVTQGFETSVYDNVDGLPLRVYDSKGLEVLDLEKLKSELINYLKVQCGNTNPLEWIHSIFYCINVKGGRLEDSEINFINDICNSVNHSVHIILTNCDTPTTSQVIEMENYIKSVLTGSHIKIIKVNSVETRTRLSRFEKFGREEALKTILGVLWSDICTRVANNYADEYLKCINNQLKIFRSLIDRIADNLSIAKLISGAIANDFDFIMGKTDDIEKALDSEISTLSNKYVAIVNPVIEFCRMYSGTLNYHFNISKITEFKPDFAVFNLIDFDKAMDRTEMGRLIKETENADDNEDYAAMFRVFGKSLKMFFRLKKTFHYFAFDLTDEMKKQLPKHKDISNEMYNKLIRLHQ